MATSGHELSELADRCEVMDLPKISCAHCRGLAGPDEEAAAVRARLTDSGWIPALYPGTRSRVVGSALGAARTAARKIGCTVEEWQKRRGNGERWCSGCRQWWFIENMIEASCRACIADRFQALRESRRAAS
jgi:hypothetical protein